MKDVPLPREDGCCVQCGKERTKPPSYQRGVPIEEYLRDPFCSNKCAKAYFGTVDMSVPASPGRPRSN